jgi:hypothetical protein
LELPQQGLAILSILGDIFVNVAKDIGKDSTPIKDCHL